MPEKPLPENGYVHGYSARESERLADQAQTLTELLHHDTHYPVGSRVLEAGCGIGAQTVILAKNSPQAHITSIDISVESLKKAEENIKKQGFTNVTFRQADIFNLSFPPASFDHIFVCFVLEHLAEPLRALEQLRDGVHLGGAHAGARLRDEQIEAVGEDGSRRAHLLQLGCGPADDQISQSPSRNRSTSV